MLPSQRALFDIPADVSLPERGGLEPAAARHPGGGARGCVAQGPAVEARARVLQRAARARPQGGGRADRRRCRGCRACLVGRLRRRDCRQAADDPPRLPRAGARERSHLAGARMDVTRPCAGLHRRDGRAACGRRLDLRRAGGDRAAGRRAAVARVDLVDPLVGRRHARHAEDPRCAATAGRGAAARRDAQRRRDRDRREDARSGFSDLPDLQMGARALRPRLRVCGEAPSGRRAARTDLVRPPQREGREPGLLRRHELSARRAALRHGRARSFHLDGDGLDRHGDGGVVGRGRDRAAPVRADAPHRGWPQRHERGAGARRALARPAHPEPRLSRRHAGRPDPEACRRADLCRGAARAHAHLAARLQRRGRRRPLRRGAQARALPDACSRGAHGSRDRRFGALLARTAFAQDYPARSRCASSCPIRRAARPTCWDGCWRRASSRSSSRAS